jgi:hypothetical protein
LTNLRTNFFRQIFYAEYALSGVYTGEKTLHVVAVASDGNLKKMGGFLLKLHRLVKSLDPNHVCE